ncbi:MAG: hypothetical protein KBC81_01110 [Candidatus Pacebacteria bacterium]|nr:hypothetical protein [Candidatus Paceibacterota bacterium]
MKEYMVLETTAPTASVEQLNELGKERWTLVTVFYYSGKYYYYFVRDKLLS